MKQGLKRIYEGTRGRKYAVKSYTEKYEMSKVKQVIRMHESGVPKKEIARRLGISKNTVKEYIKKAEERNLSPPEVRQKETPELEGIFSASVYTE